MPFGAGRRSGSAPLRNGVPGVRDSDIPAQAVSPAPAKAAALPQHPLGRAIQVKPGPTCLDETRLEARVARWLERDRIDARIRVLVSGGPGKHDVRFTLRRAEGSPAVRILEDAPEDCDSLHNAVALSIALAIDATLLERFESPDDEALTEVQEAEKARQGLLELRARELPAHHLQLRLGLAAGLSVGLVTEQAPAARLSVHALLFRWLELRLSGLFSRAEDQRLVGVDGRFVADVWAARADLCAVVQATGWLTATGCAGFQGGSFITTSSGFAEDLEGVASPLWAMGLGLEARVRLIGWLELAVFADLSLPLVQRTVQARYPDDETAGAAKPLPPAGVMVGLGPVVRFF